MRGRMSGMSEYGNRSRRLLLRAAILFAFVLIGWFAFQLLPDQRLNPIERQLLGQWSFPSLDNPTIIKQIVFYTDRTFDLSSSNGATGSGTWKAGGNNLILSLK